MSCCKAGFPVGEGPGCRPVSVHGGKGLASSSLATKIWENYRQGTQPTSVYWALADQDGNVR